jgi:hypothetical protein
MMLGASLAVLIAAGCASNPPLQTESSVSAIRAAEEVGASETPLASFHLQLAREELARAQQLATDGEKDRAMSMLRRAEADADLAILLSQEHTEKSEAVKAMERVRLLQMNNR